MRYVRLDDAIAQCGLEADVVAALLADEVIHARPTLESVPVISADELEDLRVARVLMEELGVNLEGVEVILGMRRRQIEMRRQVDRLVRSLRDEMRARLAELLGPAGELPD